MDHIDLSDLILLDISNSHINTLDTFRTKTAPKLQTLNLSGCWIHDISPLSNLNLTALNLNGVPAKDLSPIRHLNKLSELYLDGIPITDLSLLKDMPLEVVSLNGTAITDLTELKNKPLREIYLKGTKVKDLTPVLSDGLAKIAFDSDRVNLESIHKLRQCRRLKEINSMNPKDFWRQFDARRSQ